MVRIFCCGYRK